MYGTTGAGKSSLLMACLQELVAVEGKSLMNGSVAYASQRAWIQNATVSTCYVVVVVVVVVDRPMLLLVVFLMFSLVVGVVVDVAVIKNCRCCC